jgi:glycosyltransferase involved in cell wall biosynthesis
LVTPRISVVLPVYNGEMQLARTIDSILAQSEGDFELIAVDDGSTDETPSILTACLSRDRRLRVIRQANAGLTSALIRGCDEARAPLIARQDCGDTSRPERLRRMLELFSARPSCVVAAGECEFVGPEEETLYTTNHAAKDVRSALRGADIHRIFSLPAGAAAVMRADAYRNAGGYRAEFYFAQDIDLWIRMAALGEVCVHPDVLYVVHVGVGTISSVYRAEQVASATLAIALRDAPTESRTGLLREVAAIRPTARSLSAGAEANAHYFIASCLRRRRDRRWRAYARRALSRHPLHLRAWLLLLRGVVG